MDLPATGTPSWFTADLPRGRSAEMDNEIVKRLMWSGLLAASSALASIAAVRLAAVVWKRAFGEEPPE